MCINGYKFYFAKCQYYAQFGLNWVFLWFFLFYEFEFIIHKIHKKTQLRPNCAKYWQLVKKKL